MKKYDIIIVGGGISGIYSMYKLSKKYPHLKVLLLESENRYGGRIYTFKTRIDNIDYHMDLGAGRLGFFQPLIVNLIKELNLEKDIISITNEKSYIEVCENGKIKDKSNLRKLIMKKVYKFLTSDKVKKITKSVLQKMYFDEFLLKFYKPNIIKKIENIFEYTSDLYNFNMYNLISYFKNDYSNNAKYFTLKTGLNSIIDEMLKRIKIISINNKHNYKFKTNSKVNNIFFNNNTNLYNLTYINNKQIINVSTKFVICALPRENLIKFNILNPYKNDLNSINEINLLRIFEIYPLNNETNKAWFSNIHKTVTNNELQFVIPINSNNGLIMSSYSDNKCAKYWLLLKNKNMKYLKYILHKKLSHLFSIYNITIPESKYIKFHYWNMGVACWKKNINSDYMSKKILNLMPNFYICGENYSNYQAWSEGALQTVEDVLNNLKCELNKTSFNKTRKNKK